MNKKRGLIIIVVLLSMFSSVFALDEPFSGPIEYEGIRITNNDANSGTECGIFGGGLFFYDSSSSCFQNEMDVELYCEELDKCLDESDKEAGDEFEIVECKEIGDYLDNGGKNRGCPIISGLELGSGVDDICAGYTVLPGFNFNTSFSTMEEKTSAFKDIFDVDRTINGYYYYLKINDLTVADYTQEDYTEELEENHEQYLVDNALLLYFAFFNNGLDIYKSYYDVMLPDLGGIPNILSLPALLYPKYRAGSGTDGLNGVLCANNNKWIECNSATKDRIYVVDRGYSDSNYHLGPELFICQEGEDSEYSWNNYDDDDIDGYSIPSADSPVGDCNDIAITPQQISDGVCPEIDFSDFNFMTVKEYQQEIREICSGNVKYSTCAICINPSAPEVCGDNINNDCRGDDNADGTVSYTAVDDLDGKTPDDCNLFKEGCEQDVLEEDAVPNPYAEESAEELTPVQHRNVDNGYYSWINTVEGGYCCGYASGEEDKSGDVGKLGPEEVEGIWQDDRYVCLPSPGSQTGEFGHDVIGHASANPPGWEEAGCDGGDSSQPKDWCWWKKYLSKL